MGSTIFSGSNMSSNTGYIAPFTRLNKDQNELKKNNMFMNNSTYLNASNPNSMRDQGQVRNAVYNF